MIVFVYDHSANIGKRKFKYQESSAKFKLVKCQFKIGEMYMSDSIEKRLSDGRPPIIRKEHIKPLKLLKHIVREQDI